VSAARDWDAAAYHRVSTPQQSWADEQLARLSLAGDEVLLDAGCGSGKITALLADRVPRGRVYGVDAAPSMAALAQSTLGERATILCQDLLELSLPEPVDVVFSNATFHWVLDHDALFVKLHGALKPGGRLVAQCGGVGNVAAIRRAVEAVMARDAFAPFFTGFPELWNFAGPADTAERLRRAGFGDPECWLEDRPTSPAEPRAFLRTVIVVRHLDALPTDRHDEFVDQVMEELGGAHGEPVLFDYVRLNMTAHRD
jgi:trans-aconitate 2-methyltransferase